jgi:NitT/TauT family transport system substrate-binding protein
VASAAVSLLFHGACEQKSRQLDKIVFAVSYDPSSAAIFIAQEKGFFREEGIEASLLMHSTGKAALRAMEHGKAHFATIADTVLMFAGMDGLRIQCICSIADSSAHHRIIGLKSRNIAKEADLRGKRIGVPLRTTGEFFLYTFLLFRGISLSEVMLVDTQPEQMYSALQQGRIDAVAVWYPTVTRLMNQLQGQARLFEDDTYLMHWNLVAGQELLRSRPELAVRVLKALSLSERFMARNSAEAIAITSRYSRSDPDVLKDTWGNYHFILRLSEDLLINLEDQARWALKVYYPDRKTIPDYTRYLYPDGLKAVDPSAVGIRGAQAP